MFIEMWKLNPVLESEGGFSRWKFVGSKVVKVDGIADKQT